jgi:arylformamidase
VAAVTDRLSFVTCQAPPVEIFDVTVSVHPGMVVYPGDPEVRLERVSSIADGAVANVSRLDFGVHTGTHLDAPQHFVDGGAAAEAFEPDALLGPATVVDARDVQGPLDASAVARLDPRGERILFLTTNSKLWERDAFTDEFVSLSEDGARALLARGIRLVGIDYLSIGDEAAHRVLLGAGVIALEGLDLRGVDPGEYTLFAGPLKLVGADGAPARVFLVRT